MKKHRRCFWLIAATIAMPTFVETSAAAEPWPTTYFDVLPVEIVESDSDAITRGLENIARELGMSEDDLSSGPKLVYDQQVAMEAFLHEAAVKLQTWGFPPPALELHEPVLDRRDGVSKVYRLHYYNSNKPNVAGHYTHGSCAYLTRKREYVTLNTSQSDWSVGNTSQELSAVRLPQRDLNYQMMVAAHELFHAVQAGTAIDDNCSLGNWIVEGTADAVGYDLFWQIRGRNAPIDDLDVNLWGLRNYERGAQQTKSNRFLTYRTSSLWRYLAEYQVLRRQGRKPGPNRTNVDYEYLAQLFEDSTLRRLSGESKELDWLHNRLIDTLDVPNGLRRLLPNFYSVYAEYVPNRVKVVPNWDQISFGQCKEIKLLHPNNSGSVFLQSFRNGAKCFTVTLDPSVSPTGTTITLSVRSPNEADLNRISIGEAGGQRVSLDPWSAKCNSAGCFGLWTWYFDQPGTKKFIVSNVDPNRPSRGEDTFLKIVATAPGVQHTQAPTPSQNPEQKTAQRPAPGPDGSKAAARQAIKANERTVRHMSPQSVGITRSETSASCSRARERDNLCGDQLVIKLIAVPGQSNVIGSVMSTGSIGEQIMSSTGLLAESYESIIAGELEAERMRSETDGMDLEIRIPLVDYGFTGEFNNANIIVSRAEGGVYTAVYPQDRDPGIGTEFAPAGEVRIEEYSPGVLRGSFSGSLSVADGSLTRRIRTTGEKRPTVPLVSRIEGQFWIGAPWTADDRMSDADIIHLELGSGGDVQERLSQSLAAPNAEDSESTDSALSASPAPSSTGGFESACRCTCAERREIEMMADAMDDDVQIPAGFMSKTVCMWQCAAEYQACQ